MGWVIGCPAQPRVSEDRLDPTETWLIRRQSDKNYGMVEYEFIRACGSIWDLTVAVAGDKQSIFPRF